MRVLSFSYPPLQKISFAPPRCAIALFTPSLPACGKKTSCRKRRTSRILLLPDMLGPTRTLIGPSWRSSSRTLLKFRICNRVIICSHADNTLCPFPFASPLFLSQKVGHPFICGAPRCRAGEAERHRSLACDYGMPRERGKRRSRVSNAERWGEAFALTAGDCQTRHVPSGSCR